ncbi:MAG: CRISPR-associated protein Cas4 [Actinobacteria bacterium]|nr:CRISPR-associated protein Cas4 [Actinomycetota bacterium]
MYKDDDFLQLSALQHFVFCQRQCALIHIEQTWFENLFTAEGRIMHDKVHEEKTEIRKDVKIERGIPLRSNELGLNGKTDIVEFHKDKSGRWIPFPVEYKRGKPKQDNSDKVQLCAQALCLEEMLNVHVSAGAIFYGKTRHRFDVEFNESLRQETKDTAGRLHIFIKEGKTPKAVYAPKCDSCSFFDVCMPKIVGRNLSVEKYLEEQIKEP